jgi:putative ABC transport system permease protein
VNSARIAYLPPNSTDAVLLQIGFDVPRTSIAALVLVLLAVTAALLPAWRAARCPINESLGHV